MFVCVSLCFGGASLHAKGADFSPCLVFMYCNKLECHSVPYTVAQMIILGSPGCGHYCSSFLTQVLYTSFYIPALILPWGATCLTHCTYCPWFCHPNYKTIVANSKTFIYKAHDCFNHVLQLPQCSVCSHKSRRAPFSFVTSVRPSVFRCQRGCHCVDFREIWYWNVLRKSVKKMKIRFESGKKLSDTLHEDLCTFLFLTNIRNIL